MSKDGKQVADCPAAILFMIKETEGISFRGLSAKTEHRVTTVMFQNLSSRSALASAATMTRNAKAFHEEKCTITCAQKAYGQILELRQRLQTANNQGHATVTTEYQERAMA